MDTTTLAEETASSDRVCADGCERRRQGPKRIACVQLAPQHAAVKLNADTVRRLTQDLEPGTLDLLVLPEMALTGYIFADAESIAPLVEDPAPAQGVKGTSPSLDLARELATRLRCHVAIGFPCRWTPALERHMGTQQQTSRPYDARPPHLLRAANEPSTPSSSPGQIADASTSRTSGLYNAALLVDEKGALIHIARKHFAFDDDKRWSIEGPGFQTVHIPRLGKVCLAVCMDLNPYDFKAPFDDYELARYCEREGVDVLIVTMAWLSENLIAERGDHSDMLEGGPSADTANYWALRLSPYLVDDVDDDDADADGRSGHDPSLQSSTRDAAGVGRGTNSIASRRLLTFVACNRTGTEGLSRFAGTSCAMTLGGDGPTAAARPCLHGIMDREEGVCIFEV